MGRICRTTVLVAAAVLAVGNSAEGQENLDVAGVVIDVETRVGIPDVILRVLGTDVSAATDDDGRFVIRGVPAGSWRG